MGRASDELVAVPNAECITAAHASGPQICVAAAGHDVARGGQRRRREAGSVGPDQKLSVLIGNRKNPRGSDRGGVNAVPWTIRVGRLLTAWTAWGRRLARAVLAGRSERAAVPVKARRSVFTVPALTKSYVRKR